MYLSQTLGDACVGRHGRAHARVHVLVRSAHAFSSARLQRQTNISARAPTRSHLPMLAPDRRMQSAIREGIPGTNLEPLGYSFEISTARRLNTVKESDFFSTLRRRFSVQAHTFSCGLRSGEEAGHAGNGRRPQRSISHLASGVCMMPSPSRSTVRRRLPGNTVRMNGPTCPRTNFTQSAPVGCNGHGRINDWPSDVVMPNTFAFFTRLNSVRSKSLTRGFKNAGRFFSALLMIVRLQLTRLCLGFNFLGK